MAENSTTNEDPSSGSHFHSINEVLNGTIHEEEPVLDEKQIEQLAKQEEQRRAQLDEIVTRADWSAEKDPNVVLQALERLLTELRGSSVLQNAGKAKDKAKEQQQDGEELDENDAAMEISSGLGSVDEHEDSDMVSRTKYIPLRLSLAERKLLRLVEAAMNVSEYTDKVDIIFRSQAAKRTRIHVQLKEICAILSGLLIASDFNEGQKMLETKDFEFGKFEPFFQHIFEIARRHKVANPERLRNDYGKLIHLLQDSISPDILELLEFNTIKPLVTVYTALEAVGATEMLQDPKIHTATQEIFPENKSRNQIQKEIREKEIAIKYLVKSYAHGDATADLLEQAIYSISDNNAFLRYSRQPCDDLLHLLQEYFNPDPKLSRAGELSIFQGDKGGSRLNHDHRRHYAFVFQSLYLWRDIQHDMFKLWYLAEQDLLDPEVPYSLRSTGQGLNRVQMAHRVGKEMRKVVHRLQTKMGNEWVGSSVIHLGDHNVPNALTFIDKYAQVPRILMVVVSVLRKLPKVCEKDQFIRSYVDNAFGGVEKAQFMILNDFFRHAFDGSGADNFMDAGSCIDGRTTSLWNWSQVIEKKPYFKLFLLCDFIGFDGSFH